MNVPHTTCRSLCLLLLACWQAAPVLASDAAGVEFFEKRVRPIFVAHCYECHSGQAKKLKGELRLDHRGGWIKGGVSGPSLTAGKPESSLLIQAVRYGDPDTQMPPKKKLSTQAIADLEKWVAMGAPGGDEQPVVSGKTTRLDLDQAKTFWSFQPLKPIAAPAVKEKAWPAGAIDAFILSKLEEKAMRPAPPADKRTLIRRATFDLTGLPPTPEEVDAFLKDESAEAFAKVVDRLLASPHYGERWGRHWLDVVRYADTAGETADYPVPHAWRYRNYVIDAFNGDKPYDQFLHEQIAGDILASQLPTDAPPKRYAELITATGYVAIARRFGFRIDKDHHLTLEDTVDTLGKSVLGLTIGCARCHDHKYDPISMGDFYALYGIFESTRFPFPGCEHTQRPRDMMPLLSPTTMEQFIKPHQTALAAADAEYQKSKGTITAAQKKVKDLALGAHKQLAKGEFNNGGSQDFTSKPVEPEALKKVAVKKGAAIQIAVLPRGDYGADSTLIEFEISEIEGEKRKWNLSADLLNDLHETGKGNAHRDSHGNASTWCLLDLRQDASFIDKYVPDANKAPGLHLWVGSGDGFPVVGVNTNQEQIKYITVTQPARSVVVHPSNTHGGGVAVVWISPIDGNVSITGKAADLDAGGGDGVAWSIDSFASPDLGGALLGLREAPGAIADLKRKRDELAAKMPKPDLAYAVTEGTIADAKLFKRGDHEKPGDPVPRRNLELFGAVPIDATAGSGRLQLARSLTQNPPENAVNSHHFAQPLAARVMINRIWLHHFGQGLVRTPNDFGSRGEKPTHPDLLEHLAHEFVRNGWSIKSMHRAIMLSRTYQQASEPGRVAPMTKAIQADEKSSGFRVPGSELKDNNPNTAPAASPTRNPELGTRNFHSADPSNVLLSHFPRRRLSAEEIRDSVLAVSGDLDRAPGSQHPFPPDNTWSYTQHTPFAAVYDHNQRSVYLMVQRSRRHPFLSLFDGADANASTGQRQATTVPTQSLFFMNDPFVHAKAASLASRLVALPDDAAKAQRLYQLLYQRSPSERERAQSLQFLADYQAELPQMAAAEKAKTAWAALVRVMMSANEFVYVD